MIFPTKISQPKVIALAGKISREKESESQGQNHSVLMKIQTVLKDTER